MQLRHGLALALSLIVLRSSAFAANEITAPRDYSPSGSQQYVVIGDDADDPLLAQTPRVGQPTPQPNPSTQGGTPLAQPRTPSQRPQTTSPFTAPPIPPSDANALALNQPSANNMAMNSPSASYGLASTPNMIGDTLGLGFQFRAPKIDGKTGFGGDVPLGAGSVKIGEDTSPLPVDRVFFDFNHFQNAYVTANGVDVPLNRYTFGLEKTFFNGLMSVELKAPLDNGLNDIQDVTASTLDNEGTIFGTMVLTPKILLFQNSFWAASSGLALGLPTSPTVGLNTQFDRIRMFDDSTHVAPFLGLLLTPNDRWFSITYLQFDFDSIGDHVNVDDTPVGTLHVPDLMYVDCSVGYWLFYNQPTGSRITRYVTGMAPIVELHYTHAMESAEGIPDVVEPNNDKFNALNITGGFFFKLGESAGLTVAGVAPLRTLPSDKEFDAEVLVQFNRWF
jgi:hypothetical protein